MAEIPVEKKSSYTWLWILLALLLLGLLLWWLLADDDDEVVTPVADTAVVAPVDPVATTPAPAGQAEMTIPAILDNPAAFIGRDGYTGEVTVPEVPTDRGFWIENEGRRMLAIIIDGPREQPVDINPGSRLRISGATVRDANNVQDLPGDPLDADTQRLLEQQQVFLLVPEDNVEILEPGNPQ